MYEDHGTKTGYVVFHVFRTRSWAVLKSNILSSNRVSNTETAFSIVVMPVVSRYEAIEISEGFI